LCYSAQDMERKRPILNKNKRVKAIARVRVGTVKPARVLEAKPLRDKLKYKVDWVEGAGE
jgi:hypothetical protein